MDQDDSDISTFHRKFSDSMGDFARMVLAKATNKNPADLDLRNVSAQITTDGKVVIRSGGSCGIYENGVCRLCTPEEDQGTIDVAR